MGDLIDRKQALDAIDSWRREYPLDLQEPIDDCWNSIRELPAVQPDHAADVSKKVERTDETAQNVSDSDLISRKAAIANTVHMELFGRDYPVVPVEVLEQMPSAQPEQRWIPIKNRLPAVRCCRCLITRGDGRGRATVEEALFSFGRWYSNEWLENGRNREFDISASVIAWAPFPAPYRGGDT